MRSVNKVAATWASAMAFGMGALGLLAPLLATPVTSDSRYHYLLVTKRFGNSVLAVFPWAIGDMRWRLAQGRITPFGVWFQHIFYFLGMKLSLATGLELHQAEALIKLTMLVFVVAAFWWMISQLRDGRGEPPTPDARRLAVLVFTVLLVAGATTASPTRNGWTTFVVLCIGGCALMFAVAAATLHVANRWDGWRLPRRVLGAAALVIVGALLVLSYELHWAAYPMALVVGVLNGRASWRPRALLARDRGRWWSMAALSLGFLPTLVVTRLLIRSHSTGKYAGLTVDLGGPVVRTFILQFVNAVPGSGDLRALWDIPPGAVTPSPFGGGGWWWGLLLAAGAVGLLVLLRRRPTGPDEPTPATRRPWAALALALVTGGATGAAILSVSPQAHEIVKTLGDTYRGTPWLWVCMAGTLTCWVATLPAERVRWRAALGLLIAVPLTVGALVWPYSAAASLTLRTDDAYSRIEAVQRQTVLGSTTAWAEAERCRLDEEISTAARTTYSRGFNANVRAAYQAQWGRPFCGARLAVDKELDAGR